MTIHLADWINFGGGKEFPPLDTPLIIVYMRLKSPHQTMEFPLTCFLRIHSKWINSSSFCFGFLILFWQILCQPDTTSISRLLRQTYHISWRYSESLSTEISTLFLLFCLIRNKLRKLKRLEINKRAQLYLHHIPIDLPT